MGNRSQRNGNFSTYWYKCHWESKRWRNYLNWDNDATKPIVSYCTIYIYIHKYIYIYIYLIAILLYIIYTDILYKDSWVYSLSSYPSFMGPSWVYGENLLASENLLEVGWSCRENCLTTAEQLCHQTAGKWYNPWLVVRNTCYTIPLGNSNQSQHLRSHIQLIVFFWKNTGKSQALHGNIWLVSG